MGHLYSVCVGIVSDSQIMMLQHYGTNSTSTELFINILCGSIPTLKPLYDKWAHGRALSSHSKNSSNQLKDSTGSPKHTAESKEFVSKNDASLSTDNNQYGVNFEESITVTHSFDVRSAKNFAPKEMI